MNDKRLLIASLTLYLLELSKIMGGLNQHYLKLRNYLNSKEIKDEATKELLEEVIIFIKTEIDSLEKTYKVSKNIYKELIRNINNAKQDLSKTHTKMFSRDILNRKKPVFKDNEIYLICYNPPSIY